MPARWVVPLKGTSQETAEAAADLSTWIQLGNREVFADFAPLQQEWEAEFEAPPKRGGWWRSVSQSEDPPPEDIGIFLTDMRNVLDGGGYTDIPSTISVAGSPPYFSATHSVFGGIVPNGPDWSDTHEIAQMARILEHRPFGLNPTASRFQTEWLPPVPEGAIGYEAETHQVQPNTWLPLSLPLSATITVVATGVVDYELTPSNIGSASGFTLTARANRVWNNGNGSVDIHPDGYWIGYGYGPTYDPRSAEGTALGDFTVLIEPPPVGTKIQTIGPIEGTIEVNDFAESEPYLGLFSVWQLFRAVQGESGLAFVTGHAVMEGNHDVTFSKYTVRPTRFRWIYGEPQPDVAVNPRRVFPRDDGLTGGATRTWPASKAQQSSNRTFGGYL